jgi:hypothetical protein
MADCPYSSSMARRPWCLSFLAVCLLALPATLSRATDDDDPAKIQKELEEKIAKCLRKAEEAQRKAALKAAKREQEAREDITEALQEAREKQDKAERAAARREARAQHDVAKLEEQILDDLEDRVEDYVKKVHKPAAKKLPPLPEGASAEQIMEHRRGLAAAIRALRSQARPGDLFAPEVQGIVTRIVADALGGPGGAAARKEALAGNPPIDPDRDDRMRVKLVVNGDYPAAAALSTVPPSVTLTLPLLRKEVEYRFVNRDLVLLDVEASVVLDFIRNAAPPLTGAAAGRVQ